MSTARWSKTEFLAYFSCRENEQEMDAALDSLLMRAEAAEARADAGERFKQFVHGYLDQHGIPHGDPTNQHQIEGCRIGARLDLLLAERARAERLAGALRRIAAMELLPIGDAVEEMSSRLVAARIARHALAAEQQPTTPGAGQGERGMTPDELAGLRRLLEAATPGPWQDDEWNINAWDPEADGEWDWIGEWGCTHQVDVPLIVALRNHAAALLSAAERAEAAEARAERLAGALVMGGDYTAVPCRLCGAEVGRTCRIELEAGVAGNAHMCRRQDRVALAGAEQGEEGGG